MTRSAMTSNGGWALLDAVADTRPILRALTMSLL